jgi:hypothetical protein
MVGPLGRKFEFSLIWSGKLANGLTGQPNEKGRGICSHDPNNNKKDRGLRFAHGLFKALYLSDLVFYSQAHLSMMTCHHQPLAFELEKSEIEFRIILIFSPTFQ